MEFEIPRLDDGRIDRERFYENLDTEGFHLPTVLKELSEIDALELIVQSTENRDNPELFKNHSKTDVPSEGSYESFKQRLDWLKKRLI